MRRKCVGNAPEKGRKGTVNMNLLPMSYYIEVVKQQSISRAAESLQITQQTLSTHIAALEKELGCTLFIRRPKFRLTAEGELFLEYCRRFVGLDRDMRQELNDLSGEVTGTVRVGISQTRSNVLMPAVLPGYLKAYPKVRVYISEMTNDTLLTRIENDELDLVIGDVSGERPDLLTEELYREQMMMVIPRSERFAGLAEAFRETGDLKLLASCPMITNSRNDIVGRYINRVLQQNRIPPNIIAMSDSAETCLRLCAGDVGVYLCPDLYIRYFSDIHKKCYVLPLPYSYMIHLAVRDGSGRSAAVDRFAEHVRAYCGMMETAGPD